MIFPSLWEGLPGAVLEAATAELPVLASDLPGTKEIGRYFTNVRTMPLELSDEDWAAAAVRLQSNLGRHLPTQDAFFVSPFSIQYAVASSERLYSQDKA
jgi:glycosyltransferase involved in cell wall biosynthesis